RPDRSHARVGSPDRISDSAEPDPAEPDDERAEVHALRRSRGDGGAGPGLARALLRPGYGPWYLTRGHQHTLSAVSSRAGPGKWILLLRNRSRSRHLPPPRRGAGF